MKEITVQELKEKIDSGEPFTFLDVRDPFELHISNIEDIESINIPLSQLSSNLSELDRSEEIIIMCRSGNRSGKACELLQQEGFENAANLKGGINEWARTIDTSLPVY